MNRLMQGDCLERMKEMPDGSVDMILTDPPYEISNSGGGMIDCNDFQTIAETQPLEFNSLWS